MVGYEFRPKKMYHPWLPLDLFLSYFQVRLVDQCYQQKQNLNHDLPYHGLWVEGLGTDCNRPTLNELDRLLQKPEG